MIEQTTWLAICIYHEARGESTEGKIAVGHVILNRLRKEKVSVKEVVLRPWQFSWANKGSRPAITDYTALSESMKAAIACFSERLEGNNLSDADHYFANYITPPAWSRNMIQIAAIGKHIFYRSK